MRKAGIPTWAETHPDERREIVKRFAESHRESERERSRLKRIARREKDRAYRHAYYLAHRAEKASYGAHWRAANKERHKAMVKAWGEANPERVIVNRQRYLARKRAVVSTLTGEQWLAIKRAYGCRCAYCGEAPASLHQEHVIPLSKGGTHTADNIVPACRSCNSKKGDRPPPHIPAVRLML